MEHYPEIVELSGLKGKLFSLEDAMKELTDYVNSGSFNSDMVQFKNMEAEYHPENTEAGRNGGIFCYDVGIFKEEGDRDAWELDIIYYVKDGVYYLIDYAVCCI